MHFNKNKVFIYGRSRKIYFQKKKDAAMKNEAMQQSRDDFK